MTTASDNPTLMPAEDFANRQAAHYARKLGLDREEPAPDVGTTRTGTPELDSAAQALDLKFPTEAMKGTLGELAMLISRGTEISPELAFAAALTCFGAMVSGRLATTKANSDVRLYTVLLGQSARAKKSSAMQAVVDFFKNDVVTGTSLQVCDGVGSAEGLAKVLNARPNTLLCFDELETFFKKSGIESSTLLQTVASLFEKTSYESVTKSGELRIEGARLSFLACCTLQTYERVWEPASLAIGLDNRLFLVNADVRPPVAWPTPPTEKERRELAVKIQVQLAKLGNGVLRLEGTPEARARYDEWYRTIHAMNSPFVNRLDTIASRLLPLLAFTQDKDEIDLEVVEQVIAICNHQLNLRRCYNPIDAENKYARMEATIKRKLREKGPLSDRELMQFTNANRVGSWLFRQALEGLMKIGAIEKRKDGRWYLLAGEV